MNYRIDSLPGALVVHLKQPLRTEEIAILVSEVSRLMADLPPECGAVALVPENSYELDFFFLRDFASVAKDLKASQKKFVIVTLYRSVQKLLKEKGLDGLMSCVHTLDEVTEKKRSLKLDVSFVNPFIEGAVNTFRIQCATELVPEKMYVKGKTSKLKVGIAGVIGLTSKGFNGSIAICYPKEMFLKLMERMLGESFPDITSDLEDGAGELLNMIFGHAKTILNEQGHAIEKAIPTIVRGDQLEVRHLTQSTTLVIPFTSDIGPIHIEVSIQANS